MSSSGKRSARNIYDPVKEQYLVLIEYISILSSKKNADPIQEIVLLLELMKNTCRKCELYLNYELTRQGKLENRN